MMATSSLPTSTGPAVSPAEFYNALAPSYDRMMHFRERVQHASRLVTALARRFEPCPAVGIDLGCGTGAFACALAGMGYHAMGMDIAEEMISQARVNAAHLEVAATFVSGRLEDLPSPFEPGKAGLVLCLGNTLPHLLAPADLSRAFTGLAHLLAPHGAAVVQTLNYDRILSQHERIVSVDRDVEATYVRFYDFLENGLLRFNLLRVSWQGEQARPEPLLSVNLHPYRYRALVQAAGKAGLEVVLAAGDGSLAPYDEATSDTILLALCRRRGR